MNSDLGDLEKIFVFGASGHAKVVIDVVEREGRYKIIFLVDDALSLKGTDFFGYPVIGGKDELLKIAGAPKKTIVAIGSNAARRKVSAWLSEADFARVSAIHPSAQIGRGVHIGPGSVVMAGACINSDTTVGEDVIVNTRASIDHDCTIGNGVHLAPGSTLCGTVSVGDESFVCAGALVIPNMKIGKKTTIGAGSVVIHDIADSVVVAGVPAEQITSGRRNA